MHIPYQAAVAGRPSGKASVAHLVRLDHDSGRWREGCKCSREVDKPLGEAVDSVRRYIAADMLERLLVVQAVQAGTLPGRLT